MKAIVLSEYGSPDFLELKEVEKPVPKDDEVLIKVHATSINDWDWGILCGMPLINRLSCGFLKPKKVKILGSDVAGQVEAVGKDVTRFQPGDKVFGDLSARGWGGFAEYDCAPENRLIMKPPSMSFEEAAAIPQGAVIALQGLRKGNIQPRQKVLINGAGGGAGSFAIQIAKAFGANVTAVDRTEKLDMMRSIGADHVIDFKQEDFTKSGQRYDLILDLMGYHSLFDYRRALNPSGTYVMVGGSTALVNSVMFLGSILSLFGSKKMKLLILKQNKDMTDLISLFKSGKVEPVIDKSYPLSKTAEAFRYFGEGQQKGKIIITV